LNPTLRRSTLIISALTLMAAAAFLISGCSTANPYSGGSLERAVFFKDEGKDREAAEAFGMFIRRSPTDSMAAWAQLEKGMCYSRLEEYPLAAVEFQILRQEYPVSELVEDAIYQEAHAMLDQVGNIHRDISPAIDARIRFQTYIDMYPMSRHTPGARDALREIGDLIVEKNLNIAKTYRSMGKHKAAAIMLDRMMETEKESKLLDEVYLMRAKAARKLDDRETALTFLDKLLSDFPESDKADEARRLQEKITAEDQP
jgi:outer membrane assembly lipoprotein YfiO